MSDATTSPMSRDLARLAAVAPFALSLFLIPMVWLAAILGGWWIWAAGGSRCRSYRRGTSSRSSTRRWG